MNHDINNKIELKEAITWLIAFFDKFDFPLTSFEVWRYLSVKCDYLDVLIILDNACAAKLQRSGGFYFLRGRESIVATRMRRYNYANRKFKKALFFTRIFRFIPWVKMVAVGNIIGSSNMKNSGDIDFLLDNVYLYK